MEIRKMTIFRTHVASLLCWMLIIFMLADDTTGYSYDYSSSCARPYRSGKSLNPVSVPCDLNKQSFCNLPGASYPWHAVRRFVHENQGLMRRMYGDQRHISVLKAEIENNDLEDEDYQPGNRGETYGRNFKDGDIHNIKNANSKKPSGRSTDAHSIPHFRPVQTTPTSHKQKIVKEKENIASKKNENLTTKEQITMKHNNTSLKQEQENIKIISYKTSFLEDETLMNDQPSNSLEMNKIEPELLSLEVAIKQSIETNSIYPNYGSNLKNLTTFEITQPPISTSSTAGHKTLITDATTPEYATSHETTSISDVTAETTTEEENGGWKPVSPDKLSTLPPSTLFSESVKNEKYTSNDRIDHNTVETLKLEQSNPTSTTAAPNTNNQNMEGMLFQDVVQEEVKPVMKLRGVNACPVKEEVVAPFWANNTRGEILALLNLYPFEQYVHWEKCVHEHKQMFCRDGCRCEQQYRLHRLLAYDPNNECRGIFSDWFRFPSCCVCKCYDMPLEFRVTSRSPRSIEPEIDEAVKQEMYHQAASDWYTINLDD